MSIMQNHFYNIVFNKDDIIKILIKIDELKDNIYPQASKAMLNVIDGIKIEDKQNPYNHILDEIINVMNLLHITPEKDVQVDSQINLKKTEEFIEEIEQYIFDIQEVINKINIEKEENIQAIQLLRHLKKENYSLDEIQNLKYITIRFGKLPKNQEHKLDLFQKEKFVYKEISRDSQYIWIIYCTVNHEVGVIDNIFSSMNFQMIDLPRFAHGKIEVAIKELDSEIVTMEDYVETLYARIEKIKHENKDILIFYYTKLLYLKNLFDNNQYIFDLDNKSLIYVYSPFTKDKMIEILKVKDISIIELPNHCYDQYGIVSPVIVKNNRFVKPFEKLIHFKNGDNYDPTEMLVVVFMISALLLGDLGLGVLLALLPFILKGKIMPILQRLSISVMAGGFITGTVFYGFTLYQPILMMDSLLIRLTLFIFINLITYIVLMIYKEIKRKKNLLKEGYNGHFKTKLS